MIIRSATCPGCCRGHTGRCYSVTSEWKPSSSNSRAGAITLAGTNPYWGTPGVSPWERGHSVCRRVERDGANGIYPRGRRARVGVSRGLYSSLGDQSLWRARKASRHDGQRILGCGLTFATRARLSVAVQPTAPQTTASGAAVIVGRDNSSLVD